MAREISLQELVRGLALRNAHEHGGRARASSVLGAVFSARPEARAKAADVAKLVNQIVDQVNAMGPEEQRKELSRLELPALHKEEGRYALPDLPGAVKGGVVMRLAPYPSGPLHLGRARMAILNDEYVKRYSGKLILVVDDTAGSADKIPIAEAYESFPRDMEWLGIRVHQTVYKSDRLEIFYSYARQFIERGWAYVCTCKAEDLRRNRSAGKECVCRGRSAESNLEEWDRMLSGHYSEGEATVRLKTDMKDPDLAFRDRVLLRISERPHPRVGTKYRVWPMLEFSWAVDDHLLGVTHILRGKDLMMEDKMERFMWKLLDWPEPVIVHHGMLSIAGAKISSSECRRRIQSGEYEGWDDPRTWTIGSLRVRGIQPQAIRSFIVSCGLTLTDVQVPVESLYAENRRLIDPIANRYNFVRNPIRLAVRGGPKIDFVKLRLHPDFEDRGSRLVPVSMDSIYVDEEDFRRFKGQQVRLKELGNVVLGEVAEHLESDLSPSIPKIQWVSVPNVKIEVVMPDGSRVTGIADPGVEGVEIGALVQFVRFGFCRLDARRGGMPVFRYAHN